MQPGHKFFFKNIYQCCHFFIFHSEHQRAEELKIKSEIKKIMIGAASTVKANCVREASNAHRKSKPRSLSPHPKTLKTSRLRVL